MGVYYYYYKLVSKSTSASDVYLIFSIEQLENQVWSTDSY